MLPVIETLLRLQDRDTAILRIEKLLHRFPEDESTAKARLENDRHIVERSREAIQENEVALKNLELDAATRQQTIARLKTQQYETRKNEEYQALAHEIERYGDEVSNLETRELELMEKGDALRAKLEAASKSLAATTRLVEEELANISERRGTAQAQIDALRSERTGIAQGVEESILSIYERLLKKKGDFAVVPLAGDKCQGCHMKVTTSTQLSAKAQKEIIHCEQCGRMLYLKAE